MQKTRLSAVLSHALNRKHLPVMLGKVWKRVADPKGMLSKEANLAWIREHCSDFVDAAQRIDPQLWEETRAFHAGVQLDAARILSTIEHQLGRGGLYPLLYFLTRHLKPATVVETGVAAGYSSRAFLAALDANGRGTLYSSDFPYFRIHEAERYIGILVPAHLKPRWHLLLEGDSVNLPRILAAAPRIDIFHYDSDKSYSGRRSAMRLVEPHLHADSVIVFDDIQDNSFFHDYVSTRDASEWRVFEFEDKYVGVIGRLMGGVTAPASHTPR
jgi:predicted O-methyltransferase YrrM